MYSLRSLTIAAIPTATIPLSTTTTIPTTAPFCTPCWGWCGGRVLCNVLVLQYGGGVLCTVLALWEVGSGRALHSMLGWQWFEYPVCGVKRVSVTLVRKEMKKEEKKTYLYLHACKCRPWQWQDL